MNKTSTQKELLRYAYNETDLSDSDRIQKSIDGDPLVQQDYNEIHDVMKSLDDAKVSPSEKSLKAIMKKAKKAWGFLSFLRSGFFRIKNTLIFTQIQFS